MGARILMVEDRRDLLDPIQDRLEYQGFEVTAAADGDEALAAAMTLRPDLVVVDLALPLSEVLDVCRRIRRELCAGELPVVIVSGRLEDTDRILALEHGADDVLSRPYNPRELVARIRGLLRRSGRSEGDRVLKAGAIELDPDRCEVSVAGAPVQVAWKEFGLLRCLMEASGRVVSREILLEKVWGYRRGSGVRSRTLDVHVRRLRRKLGLEGRRVLTVRNVGYRVDTAALPAATGPGRTPAGD